MESPTHFLKFTVIWVDPHVFEARVYASNQRFAGSIDSYLNDKNLLDFLEKLKGFPDSLNAESITYEEQNYSHFFLTFSITRLGDVIAKVKMIDSKYHENNSVQLELYVEPAAIDNFHKQLATLLSNRTGEALLIGYK